MINLQQIKWIGENLHRPECVLTTKAGNVYCSDWRGGVTRINPDGLQTSFLSKKSSFELKPNGIAIDHDGSFLIAHLGNEDGGVFRLLRDGTVIPIMIEVDQQPLPPTNFVHIDSESRIWISVSTRLTPRADAYRSNHADGFIILFDQQGAKIVADHLGYTNECLVHPNGKWLYTNETFSRKLSRFTIQSNGNLTNKETVAEFGEGTYPDGLTFAEDGSVWVTSIVSNRIIRVDEDGTQSIVLEDVDKEHTAWVEEAYQTHTMGRSHLDQNPSQTLRNISSLAFGGNDLSVGYIGCLLGKHIACVSLPVKGISPIHWNVDDE